MLQHDSVTLIMTLGFAVQVIAAYVHSFMTLETITSQNPKLLTHQALKSNCSKSTRNSNINFSTPSKIYHQNIRGLRCKTNELISHLHPTPPHNGGWTQAVPDGHNINKTACYQITSCTVCLSNVIPTLIYAPWGWSHRGIETCRRYFKSILIR